MTLIDFIDAFFERIDKLHAKRLLEKRMWMWEVLLPEIRRIQANDYRSDKCDKCSVKDRPAWADWSDTKLFETFEKEIWPFHEVPNPEKHTHAEFAEKWGLKWQMHHHLKFRECVHVRIERYPDSRLAQTMRKLDEVSPRRPKV